jgi:hypothetical protein
MDLFPAPGIMEYWVLGIWTRGFMGTNSLQEKLKIGHLPLIPLFQHSMCEAKKLASKKALIFNKL